MQPSWCCREREGKNEGEVGSRPPWRVDEVCFGKKDGQISMVDQLLSTKDGEDTVPILTRTTASGKGSLVKQGLLGLGWA